MNINGNTKLIAIIGKPLSHTLSPFMHNYFFQSLGQNYIYLPLEIEAKELGAAIGGLWSLGFRGANITIPYKEKVLDYLGDVSEEARLIGAVNTLLRSSKGFKGENTDGRGLLTSLQKEKSWQPRGKIAVILGAGGAARAVATILALEGITKITIVNRTLLKAGEIRDKIIREVGTKVEVMNWDDSKLKSMVSNADIVINTTPLGMKPQIGDLPPLNMKWLCSGQLVADLIYNPLETTFLTEARKQGCDTLNGLGMLIHQGALSFEHWTGQRPATDGVRELMEAKLT